MDSLLPTVAVLPQFASTLKLRKEHLKALSYSKLPIFRFHVIFGYYFLNGMKKMSRLSLNLRCFAVHNVFFSNRLLWDNIKYELVIGLKFVQLNRVTRCNFPTAWICAFDVRVAIISFLLYSIHVLLKYNNITKPSVKFLLIFIHRKKPF